MEINAFRYGLPGRGGITEGPSAYLVLNFYGLLCYLLVSLELPYVVRGLIVLQYDADPRTNREREREHIPVYIYIEREILLLLSTTEERQHNM